MDRGEVRRKKKDKWKEKKRFPYRRGGKHRAWMLEKQGLGKEAN